MGRASGTAARKPQRLALPIALWGIACALCFLVLGHDASAAGAQSPAPRVWPVASALPHAAGRPTLALFMHPRCPCSRASLSELNQLLGHASSPVSAVVVFLVYGGDVALGDTYERAAELPWTQRFVDRDGREAARFGARTSGQLVVYDAGDTLQFAGGITMARGHAGDNVGRRAVERLLRAPVARATRNPVFGCELD